MSAFRLIAGDADPAPGHRVNAGNPKGQSIRSVEFLLNAKPML